MNADGSNPRRLNFYVGSDPTWSPNGAWVAYINSAGDMSVVASDCDGTITCDGNTATIEDYVLFPVQGDLIDPAWSPDGNWMLAVEENSPLAGTAGYDRLWLIPIAQNVNGDPFAELPTLVYEAPQLANSAWSPNTFALTVDIYDSFVDTTPSVAFFERDSSGAPIFEPSPGEQPAIVIADGGQWLWEAVIQLPADLTATAIFEQLDSTATAIAAEEIQTAAGLITDELQGQPCEPNYTN
jgi:dipeptidyl aminopeptidase/acylaminoacyl peptidase